MATPQLSGVMDETGATASARPARYLDTAPSPRQQQRRGIAKSSAISYAVPRRAPMTEVLALILAGGRGARLGTLTMRRAKPAIPIAGPHRIIDFTLSNCVNSGVFHIGVLTQYMARSLAPHLEDWSSAAHDHAIRSLAARDDNGYLGTADAVYQNRDVIRSLAPSYVLILAADHVYKMDYATMLEAHIQSRAQVTVGCVEVPVETAQDFGVMQIDVDARIRSFVEKPEHPRSMPGRPEATLASMGIYIFDTAFLLRLLTEDAGTRASSHDFGKDIIPRAVEIARAYAYNFRDIRQPACAGYWRDVGTVDAYWRTNLELAGPASALDLHDDAWPVRGGTRALSKSESELRNRKRAQFSDAIVPPDCATENAEIKRSVISPDVRIGTNSVIEDCVVLPSVRIGADCRIRNAIVDEGCRLPPGTVIGMDPERDRQRYSVTPAGVVLVSA
jgi:glucose-1-phosphate adenylyltransferase